MLFCISDRVDGSADPVAIQEGAGNANFNVKNTSMTNPETASEDQGLPQEPEQPLLPPAPKEEALLPPNPEGPKLPPPGERFLAQPSQLPDPTYWPFFMAIGLCFIGWGLISTWLIGAGGLIVFVISLVGWINILRHE